MTRRGLWELALEKKAAEGKNDDEREKINEVHILVVGVKNSGKTSLVYKFLEKDDAPKPTVALEYQFARKSKGSSEKEIAHIWELGGGTWLSRLADVVIKPEVLRSLVVVLTLDLSDPGSLWFSSETLLRDLRTRLDSAIGIARSTNADVKEQLKKRIWQRIGPDHQDKDMITPFPVPLIIVGGKYDVFQELESEDRKNICKSVRFLAHMHGGHLQFFSNKHESLISKAKSLFSHLAFKVPLSKGAQIDHSKPLYIPSGADSLQSIGSPTLKDGDVGRVTARNPQELWKSSFVGIYPQTVGGDPTLTEDPARDPQFREPAVDSMRAQKDDELERYRKTCERRMREKRDETAD